MSKTGDEAKGTSGEGGSGGRCGGACGKPWILLVVVLVAALAGAAAAKSKTAAAKPKAAPEAARAAVSAATADVTNRLPRLVDLGATKCMACKMMAPVLEELKASFSNELNVVFIDVWENPQAGETYGIRMIPTQVFYGSDGKELFRHEGFISREDILAKWKEFGVAFKDKPAPAP